MKKKEKMVKAFLGKYPIEISLETAKKVLKLQRIILAERAKKK